MRLYLLAKAWGNQSRLLRAGLSDGEDGDNYTMRSIIRIVLEILLGWICEEGLLGRNTHDFDAMTSEENRVGRKSKGRISELLLLVLDSRGTW
jgi:hypothetical protein